MCYRGKTFDDTMISIIFCKFSAFELSAIIRNNLIRETEFGYDVLHLKLNYLMGGYGGQGFGFNPLCKVVNCHYVIYFVPSFAVGRAPIRSMLQISNDQELIIVVSTLGELSTLPYEIGICHIFLQ